MAYKQDRPHHISPLLAYIGLNRYTSPIQNACDYSFIIWLERFANQQSKILVLKIWKHLDV